MKFKKVFSEIILPIALALMLSFFIRKFLFFQVRIPTASMYPTIKEGYRVMSTRVHNKESLKRGDIVIFDSEEQDDRLIKRLIGLPGENVKIDAEGQVYINGEKLSEPYVVFKGGPTGLEFNVPKGHYLFLGDNRASSLDARYWQQPYISEDDIEGKGRFIVFPFDKFGKFKVGQEALKSEEK